MSTLEVTNVELVEKRGDGSKGEGTRTNKRKTMEKATMEEGVTKLEHALPEHDARDETLEGHQDEMTEVIKDLESDMASTAEVLKAQTAEVVVTMTAEIAELQAKIVVLEKAVANNGPAPREVLKVKIREPKCYNGARDAKELDNFLWQVEQYLQGHKVGG